MGRSKQLLPLGDKPVIFRCLETLFAAGLKDVIVVLGPSGQAVEEVIESLPVTIVWNKAPDSDMADSVRAGMQELPETASAVLVCLVDHPLIKPETIQTLLRCHGQEVNALIVPSYKGKKGHPPLFPRSVIGELFQVATLRDVVHKDPARVRVVEVRDPGTVVDMDTPADYQKILESYL